MVIDKSIKSIVVLWLAMNLTIIIGHDTSVQQLTQKEPAGVELDGVVTQKLLFVV